MFWGWLAELLLGGKISASNIKATGIIEAYELRTIGLTANDGVQICNIDGNMVAKFYNDFRSTLNGNTTILGSLYCSAPIDAYRFTSTEIKARDATGIAIASSTGTTSINILDNSDVEILSPLKIKSLSTIIDNGLSIGTAQSINAFGLTVANSAIVNNNLIVTNNLTVNGSLTVNGFNVIKPYISLRITTSGGVASTTTVIGTTGTTTVANYGYTSSVTTTRGTVGATNAFLYTFSWTTAHPLGANYAVMCNFQGSSTTNLSPNGFFRATGTSNSISVWVRTSDGIIKDENFYVYSVP